MKFTLFIDRERCKGCMLCIKACAKAVLRMSRKLNSRGFHFAETEEPEKCVGCGNCAIMCPDAAIEIEGESAPEESRKQTSLSKPKTGRKGE